MLYHYIYLVLVILMMHIRLHLWKRHAIAWLRTEIFFFFFFHVEWYDKHCALYEWCTFVAHAGIEEPCAGLGLGLLWLVGNCVIGCVRSAHALHVWKVIAKNKKKKKKKGPGWKCKFTESQDREYIMQQEGVVSRLGVASLCRTDAPSSQFGQVKK